MDEAAAKDLLQAMLGEEPLDARWNAFKALLDSEYWDLALETQALSRLCDEQAEPEDEDTELDLDLTPYLEVAPLIAADEEKIHRCLSLAGSPCVVWLLQGLALEMGLALVEHALDHLRTADGERAALLEQVLHLADPMWVRERGARRSIRNRLRSNHPGRVALLVWLADAGNLTDFTEEVLQQPPTHLEEWSAVGRAGIVDDSLTDRALAQLGEGPDAMAYLFRLDPVPGPAQARVLCAARPDWLLSALELCLGEGLTSRALIPLMELAVRLGGQHLSAAVAWINLTHLGPDLLQALAEHIRASGTRRRLSSMLWAERRPPSASRALEDGRRGDVPDMMDAAALLRQLRRDQVSDLVHEILSGPLPALYDTVLRHVCALHPEAAQLMVGLARNINPEVAARAKELLEWRDVGWPEAEPEEELPVSFMPLGKGI